MKETAYVKDANGLARFITSNNFSYTKVYLLRKFSSSQSPPVIETVIENVIASFNNLVYEEQVIISLLKGYIIDIPFRGEVVVGIKW